MIKPNVRKVFAPLSSESGPPPDGQSLIYDQTQSKKSLYSTFFRKWTGSRRKTKVRYMIKPKVRKIFAPLSTESGNGRNSMNIEQNELFALSPSPHVKHSLTTQKIMRDVLIALVPAFIWSIAAFGVMAAVLTVLSVSLCVFFEAGYQYITRQRITVSDLSAAVTGVLLAFNLPSRCAWWTLIPGTFFAIVIVKQLFGGIGKNVVNPAIAARIFMFVSWPSQFSVFREPMSDAVSSATPLASAKSGVISADYSVLDAFLGRIPGCIGEVSALCLIIGFVYLLARRVISWHIPVSFVGTVALLSFIFPQAGGRLEYTAVSVLTGGLLLGAIFMATDYVTSPATSKGRLIFGCGCGLITVMIRFFGAYPEGVSFAIMIMNLLVWYIDRLTAPRPFGHKRKGR